jgi:hypothetical protein
MTHEELEKVGELVRVICKDTYLRKKLILVPEFVSVAVMIAPHMKELIGVLAEREANNVRG